MLTEEKNEKIGEFRSLIKKYSRESVVKLNEMKQSLEAKIDQLNGNFLLFVE